MKTRNHPRDTESHLDEHGALFIIEPLCNPRVLCVSAVKVFSSFSGKFAGKQ